MASSQSLFEHEGGRRAKEQAPLADRLRPQTFDEFVGQEHIVGPDRVLRRAIAAQRVPSFILWGPPGSGKTTLARLVSGVTDSHFEAISAVTSGVADLRRIVAEAKERQGMYGQKTILFVDEIHRFNKSQQEVILPHVEDGTFTLIGATTENPSFEVIGPLLSRSRVFTLELLSPEQIETIIMRALEDHQRGIADMKVDLEVLGGPGQRRRQERFERPGNRRLRHKSRRGWAPAGGFRNHLRRYAAAVSPVRQGWRWPLRHHIRLY